MDANLTARLIGVLLHTAKNRSVLPYSRFHALFPSTMTLAARNAMLDKALRQICDEHEADYGVLFASDNGLPGNEFFSRYRANRRLEYAELVGDPRYHNATQKQRRLIVAAERARVYEHAARHLDDRVTSGAGTYHTANGL